MINVEILNIASGACTWCGKEKDEVVSFAFTDKSFSGAMCWNDLKRTLKMKMGMQNQAKPKSLQTADRMQIGGSNDAHGQASR